MRVGSLFSGIGGIDLGLERAGMEVVWQCEIDPYCRRVLAKHWPDVHCYEDVRTLDDTTPKVDLICGGFPCQPVSHAGRRKGTKDERWLWPEFMRVIREVKPRWVLVENVPGLLSIEAGRLFGGVLRDLAEGGYDAEWDCIPAAALGAPHIRDRVFVVAYANGGGGSAEPGQQQEGVASKPHGSGARTLADTNRMRQLQQEGAISTKRRRAGDSGAKVADAASPRRGKGRRQTGGPLRDKAWGAEPQRRSSKVADSCGSGLALGQEQTDGRRTLWNEGPAPAASSWWAVEPDVGRVAHGVPARVHRLRSLGNAVVPQVAEYVGRLIMEAERG